MIFVFIIGSAFGSFLGVVSFRLHRGGNILFDRSQCDQCKHVLGWKDLIPLVSYLWLRGRCRYCGTGFSPLLFLYELVTGTLFAISYLVYEPFTESMGELVIDGSDSVLFFGVSIFVVAVLVVVSLYDIEHFLIPDVVVLPAAVVMLILRIVVPELDLMEGVLGVAAIAGLIWFLVLITKGKGMGEGDIKLGIFLGLVVGWPHAWTALLLSFVIGAVIGGGLVLLGSKGMKDMVPFGPFLAIGTLITLWFGEQILSWYQNTFLITW